MSDDFPRIRWHSFTLQLRNPFRLSYGVSETRRAFWLRLTGDEGWGEAAIPPYYGISDEAMIACWEAASRRTDSFPDEPAEIETWIGMDGPARGRQRRLVGRGGGEARPHARTLRPGDDRAAGGQGRHRRHGLRPGAHRASGDRR